MAVWSVCKQSEVISSSRMDPEYYRPNFIEIENLLSDLDAKQLRNYIEFVRCGPFGSTITCDTYLNRGVVVARPFNIEGMAFRYENLAFISIVDVKNKGLHLYSGGDIFFSRVGDIRVGYLPTTDKYPHVTISPNIIAARIKKGAFQSEYLTVFLNTKYGQQQIERGLKVVAQPTISTSLVSKIKVFIPNKDDEQKINRLFLSALDCNEKSKEYYTQAQHLLESELGLDKLSFQRPVGYMAGFSEVVTNSRFDADYYQIKYKQLDGIAAKFPVKKIKAISEKLETGVYSQFYSSVGRMYLRGVDINNGFIDGNSILRTNLFIANSKNTVIKDDILVTRVGSIGVCALIEKTHCGSFYSDNLIRIRLSDQAKKELKPSYLNFLLNTTYGQMQMVRYSRGSVQQRLNQTQLAQIPIPIIKWEAQLEIEDLIQKYRHAKKESNSLLDQAKTRVEQLIKEAVRS